MIYKIFKSLKIIWRSLQIALALVWNRAEMYCVLTGVISGKNGHLKQGNAVYASATAFRIKNWSFSEQGSAIPAKDSGDSGIAVPHVAGKAITVTGSFDHITRYGDVDLVVGNEYEAHLGMDDTSLDEVYYSGKIILTSKGKSLDVEGDSVVMTPYNFTVNGKLTLTDSSA